MPFIEMTDHRLNETFLADISEARDRVEKALKTKGFILIGFH